MTTEAAEQPPAVPAELVDRIARDLVPHFFTLAGRPRTTAPDLEVQAEARWWVRSSLERALAIGGITPATLEGRDVAQETLELIRDLLIERGQWAAVAIVSELERTDEQGRALREPPTGSLPAVAAGSGMPAAVTQDALAARRARREWGERDDRR